MSDFSLFCGRIGEREVEGTDAKSPAQGCLAGCWLKQCERERILRGFLFKIVLTYTGKIVIDKTIVLKLCKSCAMIGKMLDKGKKTEGIKQ